MYIKKLFFNFEIEIIFNSEIENSAYGSCFTNVINLDNV
jgi:hypothetical protein